MNKLFITGNLTADPQYNQRQRADGTMSEVCNFTVANNDRDNPRGADGNPIPQFYRVAVWGQAARACQQYLSKGRKVLVEGAVSISVVERDGRTYSNMEIRRANNVEFLDRLPQNNQQMPATRVTGVPQQAAPAQVPATMPNYDAQPPVQPEFTQTDDDDDLPF